MFFHVSLGNTALLKRRVGKKISLLLDCLQSYFEEDSQVSWLLGAEPCLVWLLWDRQSRSRLAGTWSFALLPILIALSGSS